MIMVILIQVCLICMAVLTSYAQNLLNLDSQLGPNVPNLDQVQNIPHLGPDVRPLHSFNPRKFPPTILNLDTESVPNLDPSPPAMRNRGSLQSAPVIPNLGPVQSNPAISNVGSTQTEPAIQNLEPVQSEPANLGSKQFVPTIPNIGPSEPSGSVMPNFRPVQSEPSIPNLGKISSEPDIPNLGPTPPEPVIPNLGPVPSEPVIPNLGPVPSEPVIPNLGPVPSETVIPNLGPVQSGPVIPNLGPVPSETVIPNLGPVQSEPVIPNLGPVQSEPVIPNLGPVPSEPVIPNLGPVPSETVIPNLGPVQSGSVIPNLGPVQAVSAIPNIGPETSEPTITNVQPIQSRPSILKFGTVPSEPVVPHVDPIKPIRSAPAIPNLGPPPKPDIKNTGPIQSVPWLPKRDHSNIPTQGRMGRKSEKAGFIPPNSSPGFFVDQNGKILLNDDKVNMNRNFRNDFRDFAPISDKGIFKKPQISASIKSRIRNGDFMRTMMTPPVDWLGKQKFQNDEITRVNTLNKNLQTGENKITKIADQNTLANRIDQSQVNKWIETRLNRNDLLNIPTAVNDWTKQNGINRDDSLKPPRDNVLRNSDPLDLLGNTNSPLEFPLRQVTSLNTSSALPFPFGDRRNSNFQNGQFRGFDRPFSLTNFLHSLAFQRMARFAGAALRERNILPIDFPPRGGNFPPSNSLTTRNNFVSINLQPNGANVSSMGVPQQRDNSQADNVNDIRDNIDDRFSNEAQSTSPQLQNMPPFQGFDARFSERQNPFISSMPPNFGFDQRDNFINRAARLNLLRRMLDSMAPFLGPTNSRFPFMFNRPSESGVFDVLDSFDRSRHMNVSPQRRVNPGLAAGTFDAEVLSPSSGRSALDLAMFLDDSKDPDVIATQLGTVEPINRDKAETIVKDRLLVKNINALSSLQWNQFFSV